MSPLRLRFQASGPGRPPFFYRMYLKRGRGLHVNTTRFLQIKSRHLSSFDSPLVQDLNRPG